MTKQPTILITNDDSLYAPGIKFLTQIMLAYGRVVVVSSSESQSAKSHAITIREPLRFERTAETQFEEYLTNGTPVDCVKMAMDLIFHHQKPDLIVSGINHGSNASINVIYSGTMAAAMEGAILGIPSIGFSMIDYNQDANLTPTTAFIKSIVEHVLTHGLAPHTCLNVNFPTVKDNSSFLGIKICRQTKAYWVETFLKRTDPNNTDYYWLTGEYINTDEGQDTDEWALTHNYVSVVPCQTDFTDYRNMNSLASLQ